MNDMQPRTIRIADVERLQHTLATVPEHPAVEVTAVEAVRMLAPQIHAMQAKGYGLGAVAELLSENGVSVTAATLKTYLRRAKGGGRKSAKSKSPRRSGPASEVTAPKTALKPDHVTPGGGTREVAQGVGVIAMGVMAATVPLTPAATTPAPKGTPATTRPADEGIQRRSAVVPKEDTRDL